MNKTPVSILQEMMVKKRMIPNYELIHDGGGTHVNTFTYRVSCEGLSATGTGRSKKDAKHEAAKAMLEKIAAHRGYPQLPASPAQSPIKTPLPVVVPASPRIPLNVPFVNAIGALQALCAENSLQEPEYIPISDEGPPHARIFTYQCVLSSFKEEGIATTKKQAKHEAAKRMLNRIKDLVNDPNLLNCENQDSDSMLNLLIANTIVGARYPELSKLSSKKVKLGIKISDYHIELKTSFSETIQKRHIENLQSIKADCDINNDDEETMDNTLKKLQNTFAALDLELTSEMLDSQQEGMFVTVLRLITSPIILQCSIGKTQNEAMYKAIINLIDTIELLFK